MADLDVRVRLTGESGQLVGQLKSVASAEKEVAAGAQAITSAAAGAATATTSQTRSEASLSAALARTKAAEADAARAALELGAAQDRAALAALRLSTANTKATGGLKQVRQAGQATGTGLQGLGVQFGDFTTQVSLGSNVFQAFGAQAGQAAFAMSSMGGVAGTVGRFLAGPFGSLILAAVTVLGVFATKLLDTEDAADKTGSAVLDLSGDLAGLATNAGIAQKAMAALVESMNQTSKVTDVATTSGINRVLAMGKSAQLAVQITRQQKLIESLSRTPGGAQGLESAVGRLGSLTRDKALADKAVNDAQSQLDELSGLADAKLMQDRNRARLNKAPEKPKKPRKEREDHSAERLAAFSLRAEESITRITEQFDAQPTLVDRVNQGVRQLDAIIADLNKKQPKGFQDMIAEAQRAKDVVRDALTKPFSDYVEQQQRSANVQSLIAAGRQDEADALQVIYRLSDQVGEVSEAQRQTILATVKAEREHNEVLAKRNVLAGAYTSAIEDARSSVEKLLSGDLSGKDFLKNLRASFNQLRAKVLTEQLLGPFFRDLDKAVQERTGIQSSVNIFKEGTEKAGKSGTTMADTLTKASGRIDKLFGGGNSSEGTSGSGGPSWDTPDISQVLRGQLGGDFDAVVDGLAANVDGTNEIVVAAKKVANSAMGLDPNSFLRLLLQGIAGPILGPLSRLLGPRLGGIVGGAAIGATEGYIRAGKVGAVLGGLGGVKPLSDAVDKLFKTSGVLKGALAGAETGTQIAGIAKTLGIGKFSTTGSQIGGAIGSAIPIPGGEIIGSVLGGIVGGLFKKSKTGSATLTGTGEATLSGNNAGFKKAAAGLGGNVQSGLQSLADQLGATIGDFAVSIGIRDGKYRVDPSGKGATKKSKGAIDFGKDGADEAIKAAIADAVKDGALTGISAAMQKALQAFGDPDKGLAEALKVKDLETALGGFGGAALNAFQQFERQAKDRLRIATTYGLAVNKVEELNARDRVKLRDQLERESFGSLQDLLTRLRTGDLFEGSAVDQRTALLTQIDAAKASAAAGEEGASDKLAQLLEQLNNVSKEVFGTAGGFAGDRSQIESTAESVISLLRTKLDDAAAQAANPQLETTNALLDEGNGQNAQMVALLQSIRDGLGVTQAGTVTPKFDLSSLAFTGKTFGIEGLNFL